MLAALAASPVASAESAGGVSVTITQLRSGKGQVLACLTRMPRAFPQCERDPAAFSAKVPAAHSVSVDFGPVPPGRYAISVFHDENGNGRLDTRLMMPREGYGFSRDAPVRFGPPSFAQAAFAVDGAGGHQTIRMRYIF